MTEGPYCRVYHSILDDPKFDGIREDVHLLGAWTLCLIVADMAYPAPAFVPPTVPPEAFDRLAAAGLVDPLGGHRFRIHGLVAERERRSEIGRSGGRASANARRNERATNVEPTLDASSPAPSTNVNIAEQSRAEQEPSITRAPAKDGLPHLNSAVAKTWEQATGRSVLASGASIQAWLDDACRRHPAYEVGAQIIQARQTFDHVPEVNVLRMAVTKRLDPFQDLKAADAKEREAKEKAASEQRRAATLRRTHVLGAHAAEAHPLCPSCQEGAA